MKLIINVDGGARGNPGPAAIAAVIRDAADGAVVEEASATIGVATNNEAEYKALILGLRRALALNASEVEVINDSELVAKQINGEYKVKHEGMKPLYREATELFAQLPAWRIRSVPRAQNRDADLLVNQALDAAAV